MVSRVVSLQYTNVQMRWMCAYVCLCMCGYVSKHEINKIERGLNLPILWEVRWTYCLIYFLINPSFISHILNCQILLFILLIIPKLYAQKNVFCIDSVEVQN